MHTTDFYFCEFGATECDNSILTLSLNILKIANMNFDTFKKITQLCEDYKKVKAITPSEYLTQHSNEEDEETIFNFLNFQRHYRIFKEIVHHYMTYHEITIKLNTTKFQLLFYVLIFLFNPGNIRLMKNLFIALNELVDSSKVLLYFLDENNHIITARIACQYFENEYVINNFVLPIMNNRDHLKKLYNLIVRYEDKIRTQKPSIPIDINISTKTTRSHSVHLNTLVETQIFHSKAIPHTTYHTDLSLEEKLSKEHEKNHSKALKLLDEIRKMPDFGYRFNYSEETDPSIATFKKYKRVHMKQNVPTRSNVTTIMREAALFAKEKEACIKEIRGILHGGVDTDLMKKLEAEIKTEEEQKKAEEIERKKLMCLLSHEEAIIAKCQVKAKNKLKYYEILKEKDELKAISAERKEKEKEESRLKIEKAHEIEKKAKEAETKIIEDKRSHARLVDWETKKLLEAAMEEKKQELNRKMQVIQEIKALHQIRKMNGSKEFDKTESPDFGLLCHMTIAELEERLLLMKMESQKKLDEKRNSIFRNKLIKVKRIEAVREFIEQQRSEKMIGVGKELRIVEETEEIKRLKKKIEMAKKIREACEECPCRPCPIISEHS